MRFTLILVALISANIYAQDPHRHQLGSDPNFISNCHTHEGSNQNPCEYVEHGVATGTYCAHTHPIDDEVMQCAPPPQPEPVVLVPQPMADSPPFVPPTWRKLRAQNMDRASCVPITVGEDMEMDLRLIPSQLDYDVCVYHARVTVDDEELRIDAWDKTLALCDRQSEHHPHYAAESRSIGKRRAEELGLTAGSYLVCIVPYPHDTEERGNWTLIVDDWEIPPN